MRATRGINTFHSRFLNFHRALRYTHTTSGHYAVMLNTIVQVLLLGCFDKLCAGGCMGGSANWLCGGICNLCERVFVRCSEYQRTYHGVPQPFALFFSFSFLLLLLKFGACMHACMHADCTAYISRTSNGDRLSGRFDCDDLECHRASIQFFAPTLQATTIFSERHRPLN